MMMTPKMKKIIAGVIAALLIISMVIPVVLQAVS